MNVPGMHHIRYASERGEGLRSLPALARDLGATLGSTLTFDIQGVPISFVVTSLRRVDWRSFSVNFFLVAEPGGPLAEAPRFVLAARTRGGDEACRCSKCWSR